MTAPAVRLIGVNERGVPQAPADVVRRLRALDPGLSLTCYRWGITDSWAVVYAWAENDPRRARIQSGELPPDAAIDILGYLPLDARPEDAIGVVGRSLKAMEGGGYSYVAALLDKVRAHNQATKDGVWQPTLDQANEQIETKASGLFSDTKGKIAKSTGFGEGTMKKRGKKA